MSDEEKSEVIELSLDVKESHIEGEEGVARISDNTLAKLGAEEGHSIEVASKSKAILVTIFADKLIEDNLISLRPGDRKKLEVSQGDKVTLKPHKTITEALGEKKEAIKDKLDISKEEEEEENE